MEHRIALFDSKPYDREAFERANISYGFDLSYFEPRLSLETVRLAEGFPVVCLFVRDIVDASLAYQLASLGVQLVALRSNGYNHIDLMAAKGRFQVVRVPKYSPYAVAEYTIALLLCINRKLDQVYWRTKQNNFSLVGLQGFDMHGKTAGVVGSGLIGSIVVRLLAAFGMRVLVYDRFPREQLVVETGCQYTDFDTLCRESDVITLHCPLVPETERLIDKEAISKMKDGVYIVNTSRGGLIDSCALIDGLKERKIGAAALDVYEEEEKFFYEDLSSSFIDDDVLARLMTFPNVFISAHQAFFTREAIDQIAETTMKNIYEFFEKKPLTNEVSTQE